MAELYPDYSSNVPDFSSHVWNAKGNDSLFEYGGFQGLHDMAGGALRGIFGEFEDFDGFHLNPDDLLDFSNDNIDIDEMVNANTGPLVFGVVGLILAFILTVFGIIWCIGKCCCCGCLEKKAATSWEYVENRFGKGSQSPPSPRSHRAKRTKVKFGLGILLICWMVIFFTFLIGLFMTNGQLRESIGDLAAEIDEYLVDGQTFIKQTQLQIDAIMVKSFSDLSGKLLEVAVCPLRRGGRVGPFEVAELTLSELNSRVTEIVQLLTTLQPKAQIPPALQSVIARKESIGKFLKSHPRQICALLEANLNTIGTELNASAVEMNNALGDVPIQESRDDLEDVEDIFDSAEEGIFWSVTLVNVILLVILFAISVGTVLALVSPDNRVGSLMVNCGLFTIFLLGWVLWIISLGLFFLSGALVVILPGAFDNIANNGSLVNSRSIPMAGDYAVPPVPHILKSCRENQAAYVVFQLDQVYNVDDLDDLVGDLINFPIPFLPPGQGRLAGNSLELELTRQLGGKVPRDKVARIGSLTSQLESDLKSILNLEDDLEAQIDSYVQFAKGQIENEIGRCEPLWRVLDSTVHTFSYKLGSPIGSYWFALNLILYLCFPIVFTALFFLRQ